MEDEEHGRAIAEVSRLLNQAERWIDEGDSEIAAVKTRKATETILINIFLKTNGHWPKRVSRHSDWFRANPKGIGDHLDDIAKANVGQIYTICNYAIHAQEGFDLPESFRLRSAWDTAKDLQQWWLENFYSGLEHTPSDPEPMHSEPPARPEPEPEPEPFFSTKRKRFERRLEFYVSRVRSAAGDPITVHPQKHAQRHGSERVYDPLSNLMEKAVEMVQRDDGWANLSDVGNEMKKLYPEFKVTDHGFPRLVSLFRSKEGRFMVSRRANVNYVRIRGEKDPPPSWAYENSDPKWLINDAIAYLEDEEGWAYLSNVRTKMTELSPNFKVLDHGHQKFKHLIESYSPMFEFDIQGTMPGDTHFSRRVRVSPVRIVISSINLNRDDEGWCKVESAEQTIDSNYKLPRFFEDHGFTDLLSMVDSYPQYFELDSSRECVRNLPPYWVTLEEAVLSAPSTQEGWVWVSTAIQIIQTVDPEFNHFRYGFSKWSLMLTAKDDLFELSQNKSRIRMVAQVEPIDYEGMTVKQLTGIARERGLSGYSKLKKADLIELIRANESD